MTQRDLRGLTTRRSALGVILGTGVFCISDNVLAETTEPPPVPSPKAATAEKTGRAEDIAKRAWLTLPATVPLPQPAYSETIGVNGANIFYARFGAGAPVIMLHGGLANSSYWSHQISELAQYFSVVVVDTRGHGRSPYEVRKVGYKVFADDMLKLMDALQLPSAAFVGWSDGAITAMQMAMLAPSRVQALFAFGANCTLAGLKPNGASSPVFTEYSARCKVEYRQLSPSPEKWPLLVSDLRAMWRREPNHSNKDLSAISSRIQVAAAEYDEIIKLEHARWIAKAIPNARFSLLENVSHFAMLQNPALFNEALLQFLKS
jgi:pimeloyl-ACP methyl ester carboxylesterase